MSDMFESMLRVIADTSESQFKAQNAEILQAFRNEIDEMCLDSGELVTTLREYTRKAAANRLHGVTFILQHSKDDAYFTSVVLKMVDTFEPGKVLFFIHPQKLKTLCASNSTNGAIENEAKHFQLRLRAVLDSSSVTCFALNTKGVGIQFTW